MIAEDVSRHCSQCEFHAREAAVARERVAALETKLAFWRGKATQMAKAVLHEMESAVPLADEIRDMEYDECAKMFAGDSDDERN